MTTAITNELAISQIADGDVLFGPYNPHVDRTIKFSCGDTNIDLIVKRDEMPAGHNPGAAFQFMYKILNNAMPDAFILGMWHDFLDRSLF